MIHSYNIKTYVIACGPDEAATHVKIGRAVNPEKRLAELQTGNPWRLRILRVFDGDHERAFHRAFQNYRACGEWFEFTGAVRAFFSTRKRTPPTEPVERIERSEIPCSDPVERLFSSIYWERRSELIKNVEAVINLDLDEITKQCRRAWDEFTAEHSLREVEAA